MGPRSRRKSRNFEKPVELPAYFSTARHKRSYEEPLQILPPSAYGDYLSMSKFLSSNRFERNAPGGKSGIEALEGELLGTAEVALIGEDVTNTADDSGLHPGIKFGGPIGTVLVPFFVYIYKVVKKKLKKRAIRARGDLMNNVADRINQTTDSIADNVTTQITTAGSAVVGHIKGKLAETGASLVQDLKAQALAQEDEIMQSIKTTILEQEKALVGNVRGKFTETGNSIVGNVKSKFSIFGWGSAKTEATNQKSNGDDLENKKRNSIESNASVEVQEITRKLSETGEDIVADIQRKISQGDTALLPDIKKHIEFTNDAIIKKMEAQIPESQGSFLNDVKSKLKERGNILFKEVKDKITCTENKMVEDVKSQISETEQAIIHESSTSEDSNSKPMKSSFNNLHDSLEIINEKKGSKAPFEKPPRKAKMSADDTNAAESLTNVEPQVQVVSGKTTLLKKIKTKISDSFKCSSEEQPTDIEESTQMIVDEMKEISTDVQRIKLNPDDEKVLTPQKDEMGIEFMETVKKEALQKTASPNDIPSMAHQNSGKEEPPELKNIDIGALNKGQDYHRSSPIDIPSVQKYNNLDHEVRQVKKETVNYDQVESIDTTEQETPSTSSSSETPKGEDSEARQEEFFPVDSDTHSEYLSAEEHDENTTTSWLTRIKNAVPHLPDNLHLSDIGHKMSNLLHHKEEKNDAKLKTEQNFIKAETEHSGSPIEGQKNISHQEKVQGIISNDTEKELVANDEGNVKKVEDEAEQGDVEIEDSKNPQGSAGLKFESAALDIAKSASSVEVNEWPSHLPKNIYKNSRNNDASETTVLKLPDEEEIVEKSTNNHIHIPNPTKDNDDRKESIISTASEFSTTSSVASVESSGSDTSTSGKGVNAPRLKLPNMDDKLQKKKRINRRQLKSLDSGVHHYYGEYIAIEFPPESTGDDVKTLADTKNESISEGSAKGGSEVEDIQLKKQSEEASEHRVEMPEIIDEEKEGKIDEHFTENEKSYSGVEESAQTPEEVQTKNKITEAVEKSTSPDCEDDQSNDEKGCNEQVNKKQAGGVSNVDTVNGDAVVETEKDKTSDTENSAQVEEILQQKESDSSSTNNSDACQETQIEELTEDERSSCSKGLAGGNCDDEGQEKSESGLDLQHQGETDA